jgi:hypothetical protein
MSDFTYIDLLLENIINPFSTTTDNTLSILLPIYGDQVKLINAYIINFNLIF